MCTTRWRNSLGWSTAAHLQKTWLQWGTAGAESLEETRWTAPSWSGTYAQTVNLSQATQKPCWWTWGRGQARTTAGPPTASCWMATQVKTMAPWYETASTAVRLKADDEPPSAPAVPPSFLATLPTHGCPWTLLVFRCVECTVPGTPWGYGGAAAVRWLSAAAQMISAPGHTPVSWPSMTVHPTTRMPSSSLFSSCTGLRAVGSIQRWGGTTSGEVPAVWRLPSKTACIGHSKSCFYCEKKHYDSHLNCKGTGQGSFTNFELL